MQIERTNRALRHAQRYWDQGLPIPLTIAARLMEQGYDVEALETHALCGVQQELPFDSEDDEGPQLDVFDEEYLRYVHDADSALN